MSSTELPELSPVLRHTDAMTIERGGVTFRIGETVQLQPEHYRYGDPLLDPHPITFTVLWIGELRIQDGVVMVPVEGIEHDPVPGRKRCILADFNALCVAAPMNPPRTPRNPQPGSAVRPSDTAPNERPGTWSSGE